MVSAAVMQDNGSLAQIGVRHDRRSQGIGTSLIAACHTGGTMRFVNVDSASEDLRGFMAALKAVRTVRQYELEMTL